MSTSVSRRRLLMLLGAGSAIAALPVGVFTAKHLSIHQAMQPLKKILAPFQLKGLDRTMLLKLSKKKLSSYDRYLILEYFVRPNEPQITGFDAEFGKCGYFTINGKKRK